MSLQNKQGVNSYIEIYSIAKKLTEVVHREIESALKSYNLTFKQWQVLNAINSNNVNTPTSIAKYIFADKPSITRITDYLVECSFLKRERGVDDRRTILLKLTDEGALVVKVGLDALQEVPTRFKSSLTSSEQVKISKFENYCAHNYGE